MPRDAPFGHRGEQVLDAPRHHHAGAVGGARADLVEPAKQAAVADGGEAREVVAPHVDLLQERRDRIDPPARLQNTPDLVGAAERVGDVFEDRDGKHCVERSVGERDVVGVGDHVRVGRECDVAVDDAGRALRGEARIARTDDEDLRVGVFAEHVLERRCRIEVGDAPRLRRDQRVDRLADFLAERVDPLGTLAEVHGGDARLLREVRQAEDGIALVDQHRRAVEHGKAKGPALAEGDQLVAVPDQREVGFPRTAQVGHERRRKLERFAGHAASLGLRGRVSNVSENAEVTAAMAKVYRAKPVQRPAD